MVVEFFKVIHVMEEAQKMGLIIVKKSGLGLLIFFVKEMRVLIS